MSLHSAGWVKNGLLKKYKKPANNSCLARGSQWDSDGIGDCCAEMEAKQAYIVGFLILSMLHEVPGDPSPGTCNDDFIQQIPVGTSKRVCFCLLRALHKKHAPEEMNLIDRGSSQPSGLRRISHGLKRHTNLNAEGLENRNFQADRLFLRGGYDMPAFDNIPGATVEDGQEELKSAYDLDFARALELDKDEMIKSKQLKSAKATQKRKRDPSPRGHKKMPDKNEMRIGRHVFKTVVSSSAQKMIEFTCMHPTQGSAQFHRHNATTAT